MSGPSPPCRCRFGNRYGARSGGSHVLVGRFRRITAASLCFASFQACREAFLVLGTRQGTPRGYVCLALERHLQQGERAPVLFVGCDVLEDRRRTPVLRDDDRRALLVRTLDQRSRIALELRDRRDVLELHDAILA